MAQLPLFPADSPVSLSVWPGSEEAEQMTAISGRKCLESFKQLSPSGCWQKTFLASLLSSPAWRSRLCLLIWRMRETKRGRVSFLLRASVPRTSDTGCSLWATPQAHDAGAGNPARAGRYGTKHGGRNLADEVLLPTPSAKSYGTNQGGAAGRVGKVRPSLEMIARRGLWPTPNATDGSKAPKCFGRGNLSLPSAAKMWPTPNVCGNYNRRGASEKSGDGLATRVGGQLNPMWVEWLQGFPAGWTALEPSATPSSRSKSTRSCKR